MASICVRVVLVLGLLLPVSAGLPPVAAAAASVYYVDCSAGSDAATGTSTTTPWRSLTKASAASLRAGDSLLLRRGCRWTGTLSAGWNATAASPITIGAYGTGAQPVLENAHENLYVTGSYLVIRDLATRADPTGTDAACGNARLGWRVGVRLMSGADHVTVRDSSMTGHYIGVMIEGGATDNRVLSNTLVNNNMRDPNTGSDAGAVGVLLDGDRNEVAGNTISGSDACSPFYGRDGAAVEVYGGRDNVIHHNRAAQNNAFTELGNPRSANNTFAYNEITSTLAASNVLVTRGAKDKYGPVAGTRFHANTVYLTGAASYAIQCTNGCGPSILSMRDNIIWANDRVGYADAAFDEGSNIYWRAGGTPKVYFTIAASSRKVDPRFVSASDLRLGAGSPALDVASGAGLALGLTTDLRGIVVPQGSAPDIGANERSTGATPAPTPAPVTPTPAPVTPTPAPATSYVVDTFGRTVTGGWGSTSPGGTYLVDGSTTAYSVSGSAGIMDVATGASRAAALTGVSARDATTAFRFSIDRLASGSGAYAYVALRGSGSGATAIEYRLKVRVAATGELFVHGTRVVGGVEADLGAEAATGIVAPAGTRVRVRASVTGSGPAVLVARAWRDGTAEPVSWQYRATDATAALLDAGHAGLRAYVSSKSTTSTVRFTFDDWTVAAP